MIIPIITVLIQLITCSEMRFVIKFSFTLLLQFIISIILIQKLLFIINKNYNTCFCYIYTIMEYFEQNFCV